MINRTINFFLKCINLAKHFALQYSKPILQIESIKHKNMEIPTVYVLNTKSRELILMYLEDLYNNENLLKKFSAKDASRIGYVYGNLLVKQNAINET